MAEATAGEVAYKEQRLCIFMHIIAKTFLSK